MEVGMLSKSFIVLAIMAVSLTGNDARRHERCYEAPPTGVGLCLMAIEGYYYNAQTSRCEKFSIGGCNSEGGNSFGTFEQCINYCVYGGGDSGTPQRQRAGGRYNGESKNGLFQSRYEGETKN